MNIYVSRSALAVFIGATVLCLQACNAKVIPDGPDSLAQTISLGDVVHRAGDKPVHILYVHGMNATDANDSLSFRDGLCAFWKDCDDWTQSKRDYVDKDDFFPGSEPPHLTFLGPDGTDARIWADATEWSAAAPFVIHWVTHRRKAATVVVVDELNWYPLVLSAKCRKIIQEDARLAGPNRNLILSTCSHETKDDQNTGRYKSYPWIRSDKAKELIKLPSRGAKVNRALKNGLMDWGFSDAMLAVGPMRDHLQHALRQLFVKSADFYVSGASAETAEQARTKRYNWQAVGANLTDAHGQVDQEFVIVTHSLGSYLVFSTLRLDAPARSHEASAEELRTDQEKALKYIFERTTLMYCFANQIPLIELSNLELHPSSVGNPSAELALSSPKPATVTDQMQTWSRWHNEFRTQVHNSSLPVEKRAEAEESGNTQMIAFSDPSDLLTWRVPRVNTLTIVNLYVHNATHWLWLLENPIKAHNGYAPNKEVIRTMLEPTKHYAAF